MVLIINEPCVYKKIVCEKVVLLVLYVDDIILAKNDVGILLTIKVWLIK